MQSNKLNAKDLIHVGIYTAIYIVIFFAIGMLGAIPILYPLDKSGKIRDGFNYGSDTCRFLVFDGLYIYSYNYIYFSSVDFGSHFQDWKVQKL